MGIANYLTFFRIFISPVFLLIFLEHEFLNISRILLPYILLILLGITEFSDAIDGYLARKYNQVTDLGKILDPMADTLYHFSVFLTFTLPPINLPILLLFIFLYRESVVSALRTLCALKGYALAARPSGKWKAALQAFAAFLILVMMIPHSLGILSTEKLQQLSLIIVSFAAAYTIYSGVDYLYANWGYIVASATKFNPTKKTKTGISRIRQDKQDNIAI